MRTTHFSILAVAALLVTASCQKDQVSGLQNLDDLNTVAYTPVTSTDTTKTIDFSVLDSTGGSFDTHQAWFDFRTISAGNKGTASLRTDWHLGFYSVGGTNSAAKSINRVILNYSVKTQAKLITGATSLTAALAQSTQLNNAVSLFDGGTFNMGDISTFDFHKEGQFVIGSPSTTSYQVYLVRTQPVTVHPDTTSPTPQPPVNVSYWLVRVKSNTGTTSGYYLQYRALSNTGSSWSWAAPAVEYSNIAKDANYQYLFVKFGEAANSFKTIQPIINNWNLGLSAVTLKRYTNTGDAYPWDLKGVVINNNPGVKIYSVRHPNTEGTNAGAPGPYDPNYAWSSDPARDPNNDVSTIFDGFDASDIVSSKFSGSTQEEVGQYWRYLDMGNYRIFVDRFFVIQLQNGNVYKLKFNQLGGGASTPVNNGISITYEQIATNP